MPRPSKGSQPDCPPFPAQNLPLLSPGLYLWRLSDEVLLRGRNGACAVSLWGGTLGCQGSRGAGRWRVERSKLVEVLGPRSEPPVCLGRLSRAHWARLHSRRSQSVLTHTNLLPCTQGGRPLLADSLSPPPSVWSGKRPLPVCALPHCLHRCPVGPQQPGRGKASVLGKNPEQRVPGAGVLGTSTAGRGDASWNSLATPGREAQRTSSE